MSSYAQRIARLEEQVKILRTAIGLLTVSGAPTVVWMDASFENILHEEGADRG